MGALKARLMNVIAATEAVSHVGSRQRTEGLDFSRNVHCLLGLPIDAIDVATAVRRIHHAATTRQRCFLTTPNLNFLIASIADKTFRESVIASDLSVADGMPLVWIARAVGIPIRERVAGSTIFEALAADKSQTLSVFFFGGPPGIAEIAAAALNARATSLNCVGFLSPGYGSVEDMSSEETIAEINRANPDFVVVALGAKKGQAWIMRNRERLSAPIISHLGAVVNFTAGTVSRAPGWMQRAGLEWLWRIKEEPGLWNRYFADGIALLNLLFTRVLPYALWRFVNEPSPADLSSASVEIDASRPTQLRLVLRGAWSVNNLHQLRNIFDLVLDAREGMTLDMRGVSYADSRFWGVILVLVGALERDGKTVEVHVSNRLKNVWRFALMDIDKQCA